MVSASFRSENVGTKTFAELKICRKTCQDMLDYMSCEIYFPAPHPPPPNYHCFIITSLFNFLMYINKTWTQYCVWKNTFKCRVIFCFSYVTQYIIFCCRKCSHRAKRNLFLLKLISLHNSTVGSTAVLHQEGFGFKYQSRDVLDGVCMFFHCMRGSSLVTLVFSHCPKTCLLGCLAFLICP